jgi:small subunit ribosomal protein S3
MGQKTHPVGFRLGVLKDWKSTWYAEKDFPRLLKEDETIRRYLERRLAHAAISQVTIERKPSKIVVTVHTARPGVVIGKRGAEVDKLRDELGVLTNAEVSVNVEEVKRPELDARLVAENVAHQIRNRISFRRAMKRAIQSSTRAGAEGIRIKCAGRLGGAEIARTEGYSEGRVPLHTLRADIDYSHVEAFTTYGCVGVKCWIFLGEVMDERRGRTYSTDGRTQG